MGGYRGARHRQGPVQVGQGLNGGVEGLPLRADRRRQFQQNALDFAALRHLQRANLVPCVNRRQRFHEDGGAAGRHVVDDTREVALPFAPYRHGQPSAALGNQAFAEDVRGNLLDHAFQQTRQAPARPRQQASQAREFRRGLVTNIGFFIDGGRDATLQIRRIAGDLHQRPEGGKLGRLPAHGRHGQARGAQVVVHVQQVGRVQARAAGRPLRPVAHVPRGAHAERRAHLEELTTLGREFQAIPNPCAIGVRAQRQHPGPRGRE